MSPHDRDGTAHVEADNVNWVSNQTLAGPFQGCGDAAASRRLGISRDRGCAIQLPHAGRGAPVSAATCYRVPRNAASTSCRT